jgi:hypothetical protein
MLATDRSHLISLLKTALKYVATLSFTEGLSGSPLNLHAIVSNSHPVFRKCLVCIPLDVLTEVGRFFGYLKEFHKLFGPKLLQLK